VMNKHREVIYKKRREMLETENWKSKIENWLKAPEAKKALEEKMKELGENFNQAAKFISLRTLDMLWLEHLENMEYLRDSVRLRAYGQQDPLIEYKNEGHKMFRKLLETFESTVANMILRVSLQPVTAPQPVTATPHYVAGERRKLGRNDPCPCGKINPKTGKPMKYKKCCYPKFG